MKKLKWKYAKKYNQWNSNDDYIIIEMDEFYELFRDIDKGEFIGKFKKLNKAQKIAQLIYEG